MQITCSWCGKNLGTKNPKHDKRVTHGICKKCSRKELNYLLVTTTAPRRRPGQNIPQATHRVTQRATGPP